LTNNSQLSNCSISSICNHLDNGGSATISNNGTGCNSVIEVENDCEGLLYVFDSPDGVWHESMNWLQQAIPDSTSYVLIPDGTNCEVEVDSIANCNYIHIFQNANFLVNPGAQLNVFGN
jgi:hypothetical protein